MPTRQREHFKQHVSTNMANRLATRNETEETRKRETQAGPRRGEKARPEGEGQEEEGRRRREEGKATGKKGQNPRERKQERRAKKKQDDRNSQPQPREKAGSCLGMVAGGLYVIPHLGINVRL